MSDCLHLWTERVTSQFFKLKVILLQAMVRTHHTKYFCVTFCLFVKVNCILLEIGHNFGSSHDPVNGGECDPPRGLEQGKFIMHQAAVDGTEANNKVRT